LSATTPSYDNDNIFAKILRGEIPCHKVFENEDCFAFMDIMPQSEGHCLVLPKAPSRNLLDAETETLANLMPVVQTIARAAKTAFDADGISIQQFNEAAGGQTVFHLHIHIIPRFEGIPLKPHTGQTADHEHLANLADKLKQALASS